MSRDTRLFIRLDLDYPDHPKIMGLSDAAFRAHITLMAYSRKYMTDGYISNPVANRLANQWDTDVLTELQTNDPDKPSLKKLEDGGYELHGYADMQETKAEIEARQRRNAANGRKGGRPRKRNKTHSVTDSGTQPSTDSGTQTKAETETETDIYKAEKIADAFSRDDVLEVFNHFNESLKALDAKPVTKTQTSADAIRRLIDLDGRTVEQIKTAIDFAHGHDFWRSNILSPKALREKYDTLRLQAQRAANGPQRPADQTDAMWAAGYAQLDRQAQEGGT